MRVIRGMAAGLALGAGAGFANSVPLLGAVRTLARRTVPAWLIVPLGAVANLELLPLPEESRMAGPVYVTVWAGALAGTALVVGRAVGGRPNPRPISRG
ncbi:hypothetical protein ACFQS1_11285 [Paractinoplanes rhizophilus]|uniref:Uncharacterized protein n=1 Tax=Paractinoplanes rhizophilus TaxID=1416877 RepID=A0ABW2HP55_9ACTN